LSYNFKYCVTLITVIIFYVDGFSFVDTVHNSLLHIEILGYDFPSNVLFLVIFVAYWWTIKISKTLQKKKKTDTNIKIYIYIYVYRAYRHGELREI